MIKQTPDITKPPSNYPRQEHATNSFSHSPSFPQISSYLIIGAEIIIYFTCINKMYTNYILMGFYCGSALFMIISKIVCAGTNPTDQVVYHYKWSKINNSIKFQTDYNQNYYCEYCESFCKIKSKHCKTCNRCTQNFDHHCIWINNCIGQRNYCSFIFLIISTFTHIALFLIAGSIMSNQIKNQVFYNLIYSIPVWVLMAILGILQIFLMQLIILHGYLKIKGITTYQFLIQKKRSQDLAKKQAQQKVIKNQNNIIHQLPEISDNKIKNSEQTSKIQIKPKRVEGIKQSSSMQTLKKSGFKIASQNSIENNDMDIVEMVEYENVNQEMPSFLNKNKSLKLLFGSNQVQAPIRAVKSSKRINTIV